MHDTMKRTQLVSGLALMAALGLAPMAQANTASVTRHSGPAAPVSVQQITEADVIAAQTAWGNALVTIARDFESGGFEKARATASSVLDAAYGYQMGPVLFKPTLTVAPQTFRTTKEGALAYFVGGNPAYPNDTGFALKGWRSVEVRNSAMYLNGSTALVQGNVSMTDRTGKVTTVDKTWGYQRDDAGNLRIVLHHSSLPMPAPAPRRR